MRYVNNLSLSIHIHIYAYIYISVLNKIERICNPNSIKPFPSNKRTQRATKTLKTSSYISMLTTEYVAPRRITLERKCTLRTWYSLRLNFPRITESLRRSSKMSVWTTFVDRGIREVEDRTSSRYIRYNII